MGGNHHFHPSIFIWLCGVPGTIRDRELSSIINDSKFNQSRSYTLDWLIVIGFLKGPGVVIPLIFPNVP